MTSEVSLGLPALIILTKVQDKHPSVNKNASIKMSDFIPAEAPDGRRLCREHTLVVNLQYHNHQLSQLQLLSPHSFCCNP